MVDFPSPVKVLWKQTYPEVIYPVKVDSESYTLMISISFLVCTLESKSAPSILIMWGNNVMVPPLKQKTGIQQMLCMLALWLWKSQVPDLWERIFWKLRYLHMFIASFDSCLIRTNCNNLKNKRQYYWAGASNKQNNTWSPQTGGLLGTISVFVIELYTRC